MSRNIGHNTFQRYIQDPREAPKNLLEALDVSRSKWKNAGKNGRHNMLKKHMEVSGNTIREGASGVHGSKKLNYLPYRNKNNTRRNGGARRRCYTRRAKRS